MSFIKIPLRYFLAESRMDFLAVALASLLHVRWGLNPIIISGCLFVNPIANSLVNHFVDVFVDSPVDFLKRFPTFICSLILLQIK